MGMDEGEEGNGTLGQRLSGAGILALARLDSDSDMVDTMTNCFITDDTTRKRPQDP